MKNWLVVLIFVLASVFSGTAEAPNYDYRVGVQLGAGIGGVVSTPFRTLPRVFRTYPQVVPVLGVKGEIRLVQPLYLGLELLYQRLDMDVEAVVKNTRACLPGGSGGGENLIQYYTGQARVETRFDELKVPLYLSYAFPGNHRNRFLIGFYASWMLHGRFENIPIQGYVGGVPDRVDVVITHGDEVPAEQCNFSKYLNRWNWGVVLGYDCEIYHRIQIGLHVSCGLRDVFDEPILTYNMTPFSGSLMLSYALWEIKEK